jgi:Stage III sporulation protein AF (Spore_III_AF).
MAAVRTWLTGVVAASLLISAAESLIPPGTLRKIASLTGGLILLLVLVRPLAHLDAGEYKLNLDAYSNAVEDRRQELEKADRSELEKLIAEKSEAYISDRAAALGISCTAEVTTKTGTDGMPYPAGAELSCAYSPELAALMEQELGIPRERQAYHGTQTKDGTAGKTVG